MAVLTKTDSPLWVIGETPWSIVFNGSCVDVMRDLPENSIDALVSDPPYGLEFLGHKWDKLDGSVYGSVLEDPAEVGGFQDGNGGNPFSRSRIRYGRGGSSPERQQWWHLEWAAEAFRILKPGGHIISFGGSRTYHRMACAIEDAGFEIRDQILWSYGTGFPKSLDVSKAIDKMYGAKREVVGYKSAGILAGGVHAFRQREEDVPPKTREVAVTAPATPEAKEWDGWGTALKPAHEPVVLGRKPLSEKTAALNVMKWGTGALNIDGCRIPYEDDPSKQGRWPANIILDPEAGEFLDKQAEGYGQVSRFFYSAKASKKERDAGLEAGKNIHPTVKPIALMRYLCRLVTPPGGTVLDPFMGSGSTIIAANQEGFNAIGIEKDPDYAAIARQRIEYWQGEVQSSA